MRVFEGEVPDKIKESGNLRVGRKFSQNYKPTRFSALMLIIIILDCTFVKILEGFSNSPGRIPYSRLEFCLPSFTLGLLPFTPRISRKVFCLPIRNAFGHSINCPEGNVNVRKHGLIPHVSRVFIHRIRKVPKCS